MKYYIALLLFVILLFSSCQSGNSSVAGLEKDTVLSKLLRKVPEKDQAEFIKEYHNASPEQREKMVELFNFIADLPRSSKKQLIQNIDTNYKQIAALRDYYKTIVPANYRISIEFKPPEEVLGEGENIDFHVFKEKGTGKFETVCDEWDVKLSSVRLDSLLALTPLTHQHLKELKGYLDRAHCISISRDEFYEIGYSRSGMGMYSYLIFDKPLTKKEQKIYNNGCEYIFYRDNIVLEWESGATGSLCFPDK